MPNARLMKTREIYDQNDAHWYPRCETPGCERKVEWPSLPGGGLCGPCEWARCDALTTVAGFVTESK